MNKALHWFSNDLRLQDNHSLNAVIKKADSIAFIYIVDPRFFKPDNYHHSPVGKHRWAMICDSLYQLESQLHQRGHHLNLYYGYPELVIPKLVASQGIELLSYSKQIGLYEQQCWQKIQTSQPQLQAISIEDYTLYQAERLSLTDKKLTSFTAFRKSIEKANIEPLQPHYLSSIPSPIQIEHIEESIIDWSKLTKYVADSVVKVGDEHTFSAGELTAKKHLNTYFLGSLPSTYKQTRNALSGWENSTKFSHFLSLGNLSARQIWHQLKQYETEVEQNESTYWIGFELLWREYFQYLALHVGHQLFTFKGVALSAPLTSYFPQRFIKWCQGNTPFALVNACMHELNETGYLSNRGRQIVASCLVNELGVDWRFGAAYFQQQLIDYDVASNWGNWQYIAGVGADPRGGRHFNIDKQTTQYDPDSIYIKQWQGEVSINTLDSVDIVDWPTR